MAKELNKKGNRTEKLKKRTLLTRATYLRGQPTWQPTGRPSTVLARASHLLPLARQAERSAPARARAPRHQAVFLRRLATATPRVFSSAPPRSPPGPSHSLSNALPLAHPLPWTSPSHPPEQVRRRCSPPPRPPPPPCLSDMPRSSATSSPTSPTSSPTSPAPPRRCLQPRTAGDPSRRPARSGASPSTPRPPLHSL